MYNVEIINYCQSCHVDHSIYIIYLYNMEHFGALLNLVNLPMHIELFSRVSQYCETMELLATCDRLFYSASIERIKCYCVGLFPFQYECMCGRLGYAANRGLAT